MKFCIWWLVILCTYPMFFFCKYLRSFCLLRLGGIEREQCPVPLPCSEAERVTKARTPELFDGAQDDTNSGWPDKKSQCRKLFYSSHIYDKYASLSLSPLSFLSLSSLFLSLSFWVARARAIQHYTLWAVRNSVGMGAHSADENVPRAHSVYSSLLSFLDHQSVV